MMSQANKDSALCDFVVRGLPVPVMAHLDLVCNPAHPFNAPRGLNRLKLFRIARDVTGQADDTAIGGDADVGGIDAGLIFEFIHHILPKLKIAVHAYGPFLSAARCRRD